MATTLRFEWDPQKAEANAKKHGITFRYASLVFQDPLRRTELEGHEHGEERWRTVGSPGGVNILVVSHTIFDEEEGVEIIRIISARKAEPRERRRYERLSRMDR